MKIELYYPGSSETINNFIISELLSNLKFKSEFYIEENKKTRLNFELSDKTIFEYLKDKDRGEAN